MKRYIGIVALFILLMQQAMGQVPYFQQYFLATRNEPVQVNTIFEDKSGIIWFGTDNGLYTFNGLHYTHRTTTDSLPDNHVTAITQDSLGRIWTGYKNGQIAYIEDTAVKLFAPDEGLSSMPVSDLLFDRNGNLWFSTLNDGLYYFTQNRLFRLDDREGMPDLFVYDLAEDHYGNIWAGTDGGAAVCTLTDKKVKIKVINYDDGLPDNIVKKLIAGETSSMWMATEDAGLIQYDLASGKVTPLIENWEYGTVSDFLLHHNQVWIASPQAGIIVHDLKTSRTKVYNTKNGRGFASIEVLRMDSQQNIWVGSKTGVMRTHGDAVEFVTEFDPSSDKNVLALAVDQQGTTWFANTEGIFKRTVDKTGSAYTQRLLANTPFSKYAFISLYVDSAGFVWAGMYGEGVIRINPTTGKIKHLQKELRNGNVLSITGKGNEVWLATLGGCSKISIKGDELVVKNYSSEDGLISDYIYHVFVDSQNRVWIATDGKGVDMLDEDGFHHFQEGLTSTVVYSFAEDANQNIWVNTQSGGVFEFDGAKFRPFRLSSKLRDNNITIFTSDNSGNLVMMHDLGIEVYDIKTERLYFLGDEVGIHEKKPNLNAVTKDDRGRLYLGTEAGIVSFAGSEALTHHQPVPLLAHLKVFDRELKPGSYYNLPFDENNLTIQYLGLWYQNPAGLHFQYKMDNHDVDWISTHDLAITYSKLLPGSYTFHLKVSETEDFTDALETSFQVEINPPFWRTATFFIMVGFTVILLGYSYLRYRERRLVKDKVVLEAKVEERTLQIQKKNMEIQAQNDEIQAQNEEIQAQAEEIKGINENLENLVRERTRELEQKNKALEEYAFINAHKLRAPVASILGLINLIGKHGIKEQDADEIKERLQTAADELDKVVGSITKAIERGDT